MSHLDEGTLHALLDGEIPSEELAPVLAHLEGCADCRAMLDEVRGLATLAVTLVDSLGDGTRPAQSPRALVPSPPPRREARYRQLAWAATVVLAVGVGYWAGGQRGALVPEPAPQLVVDGTDFPLTLATESTQGAPAAPATGSEAVGLSPQASTADRTETTTPTALRERAERAEVGGAADSDPPLPAPVAKTATGNQASVPESRKVVTAPATVVEQARVMGAPVGERRGLAAVADQTSRPGSPLPAAELSAPGLAFRSEVATESYAAITFTDAVAQLGGTLRLIDGLLPDRLEASATTVRVVYPLAAGELVLEQRRQGDSIVVALRGPLSADSLAVLRGRIR